MLYSAVGSHLRRPSVDLDAIRDARRLAAFLHNDDCIGKKLRSFRVCPSCGHSTALVARCLQCSDSGRISRGQYDVCCRSAAFVIEGIGGVISKCSVVVVFVIGQCAGINKGFCFSLIYLDAVCWLCRQASRFSDYNRSVPVFARCRVFHRYLYPIAIGVGAGVRYCQIGYLPWFSRGNGYLCDCARRVRLVFVIAVVRERSVIIASSDLQIVGVDVRARCSIIYPGTIV